MNTTNAQRQLMYLVLDGLGDEPCSALSGRTPLAVAATPTLDSLARRGQTFRLDMRDPSGDVSTNYGQFALFGYGDDVLLPARGPVEAAGTGIELMPGDVAFRANWATFDERGRIVDRRAGRIREGVVELSQALDGLDLGDGVRAVVRAGTEHRVALVLRGPNLGAGVADTDPVHTILEPEFPLPLGAVDPNDEASRRTADKLARLLALSQRILRRHPINLERVKRGKPPANGLLTRRCGTHLPIRSLKERFGVHGVAIAGGSTVTGVMQLLGLETVRSRSFTANVDTDLQAKFDEALRALTAGAQLVMVHVKALDILAHDRDAEGGIRYLERIDEALAQLLRFLPRNGLVAIGADHTTSSESGNHTATPPPALLCGPGVVADRTEMFNEVAVQRAGAKVIRAGQFFWVLRRALVDGQQLEPAASVR